MKTSKLTWIKRIALLFTISVSSWQPGYAWPRLLPQKQTAITAAAPYPKELDLDHLRYDDLMKKTTEELRLLRNTIYARHGMRFHSADLKKYFATRSWYIPREDFSELDLTDNEFVWVKRIQGMEREKISAANVKLLTHCGRNKVVNADLDGDGKQERIIVSSADITTLKISVGTETLTEGGPGCVSALGQINAHDNYKVLIVGDEGPSDDLTSRFYRFIDKRFVKIGDTGGMPMSDSIILDGSGTVVARERGSILHTWFYLQPYKIGLDHLLTPIKQQYVEMNTRITLLRDLPLVMSPTNDIAAGVLKKGTKAVIKRTDNKTWLELVGINNIKGWLQLQSYSEINGVPAAEYMDGLSFAD